MLTKAIYHNSQRIAKIYHSGSVVFQESVANPVEFHVIEDGKLIILGAMEANSLSDGLYLDCGLDTPDEPDTPDTPAGEWENPVQDGYVLTLKQVYGATQNGYVLEVE